MGLARTPDVGPRDSLVGGGHPCIRQELCAFLMTAGGQRVCCLPRLHLLLQVPLRAKVRQTALPLTLGSSPEAASKSSEAVWKQPERKRSGSASSAKVLRAGARVTPALAPVDPAVAAVGFQT